MLWLHLITSGSMAFLQIYQGIYRGAFVSVISIESLDFIQWTSMHFFILSLIMFIVFMF